MKMMKSIMVFLLAASMAACGCTPEKAPTVWVFPDQPQTPTTGDDNKEDEPGGGDTPVERTKPLYIWIDAAANFPDFANSKDNIRRDLKKAADCGFTDVVVDVRPVSGDILFKSDKCDQVKWLGSWVTGKGYVKTERTADWDYLGAFIEIGHELGLRVHAGFNTMVGGHSSSLGKVGMLVRDSGKRSWASVSNTESGFVSCLDQSKSTYFVNPVLPEVQDYICGLLEDLAAYEDLDGIILDRCRFDGLEADFSEYTKAEFEKSYGKSIDFTTDVMPAGQSGTVNQTIVNTYPALRAWFAFRAGVINGFVKKARTAVKAVNPDIKFGVYVGAWYSSYYDVGVNWASPSYKASSSYYWANTNWDKAGYADQMDQMLLGAYASPGSIYGSSEWTMQGFCKLGAQKIGSDCPLVVGGPDVGNWDSEDKFTDAQEYEAITKSVDACYNSCGGYFLFDMIHLKKADSWQYVADGITRYAK